MFFLKKMKEYTRDIYRIEIESNKAFNKFLELRETICFF